MLTMARGENHQPKGLQIYIRRANGRTAANDGRIMALLEDGNGWTKAEIAAALNVAVHIARDGLARLHDAGRVTPDTAPKSLIWRLAEVAA